MSALVLPVLPVLLFVVGVGSCARMVAAEGRVGGCAGAAGTRGMGNTL